MSRKVDVVIIGAGSAGLSALAQVRRTDKSFVIINDGYEGTTCARVGCMPSKALIETANLYHSRRRMAGLGLSGADQIGVDGSAVLARVRDIRDKLVKGVIGSYRDGLTDDQFIRGRARLLGPDRVTVNGEEIQAGSIIIATGSSPVVPAPFRDLGDALITTDTLFEQTALPRSLAVVGLGAIGCEVGQALGRLGVSVHGFDLAEQIAGIRDPEVARVAAQMIGRDMRITTGVQVSPEPDEGRVRVNAGGKTYTVDKLLASLGRRPNTQDLGLDSLGVALDERGMPEFDRQTLQIGSLPVYFCGDVNGDRPLLHEANDEGRIAALNAVAPAGRAFRRRVPLAIAFTEPQIVTVGAGFDQLDPATLAVGTYQPIRQGRAMIKGSNEGLLRIYADRFSGRLLGATLLMADAEHMGHWLSVAIDQGLTLRDCLGQTFYHPVMEEAMQAALQRCLAQCEDAGDLPPGMRAAG
ncbi:dihydrolipoyl dehydrogenase [Granulosicoccaceae sp. 1_MG-2023]|nr:dihydrolipoyl dehydrogenase [Granulosicoccaceae sp. 1_MG-2023]